MSTLVYAALTRKREEAPPQTSGSTSSPGLNTYVDALAALVPAEVLALHATVLSFTAQTVKDSTGNFVTKITDPLTLQWTLLALLLLSMGLYVVNHRPTNWDLLDFARVLIPPLALLCWTMLQKGTAFDALGLNLADSSRFAIAVIGGCVLGITARQLAVQADQKSPQTQQPAQPAGIV